MSARNRMQGKGKGLVAESGNKLTEREQVYFIDMKIENFRPFL